MMSDEELTLLRKLYIMFGTEIRLIDFVYSGKPYEDYRRNSSIRHIGDLFLEHPDCEVIHDHGTVYKFKEYPRDTRI